MVKINNNLINHFESKIQLEKVKKYRGVWGWMMTHIFHLAIKTSDEEGNKIYLNKKSLIKKLCDSENPDIPVDTLKKSKALHQLMLEVLNPVIGKPIKYSHVRKVFRKFRTIELKNELKNCSTKENYINKVAKKIEEIKTEHLKVVKYNANELEKVLKPGDVFFRKIHPTVPNNIVKFQKIQRYLLGGIRDREGYKYSHAAMYVGDGKIAEAAWPSGKGDEIRIISLADSRFALHEDDKNQFIVSRHHDATLAAEAAEVAKKIATELPPETEGDQKTKYKYTIIQAARSIWRPANFGIFAKQRYLKQYSDYKKNVKPRDFTKPKSFFCSYLVGYCYQTAEGMRVLPKILGKKNLPKKGKSKFGTALIRGIWARVTRWKNLKKLDKNVQMKFDAKRMSPQEFRSFIMRRPDQFKDIICINS